jgi:hypothetical protein
MRSRWTWSILLAVVGTLASLLTLDQPGLTVDEPINAAHGKRLVWLAQHGRALSLTDAIDAAWGTAHDHPPLTRLAIGLAQALFDPAPDDPNAVAPKLGRPASALAFGILIALATLIGGRLAGTGAGISSGIATLLLPRLFGHAQLASPEVLSAAAILAGWYVSARALESARRRSLWLVAAGLAAGLALLTKLTAILLPAAAVVMLLAVGKMRSVGPILIFGTTAAATFIFGWPWMWPVDAAGINFAVTGQRLVDFLNVGLNRATIYVEYLGLQYPNDDARVPWHYVWFFFFATVPIGLHVLAAIGAIGLIRQPGRAGRFLLLQISVFLCFFTLPIDRYDGERLFLAVFPFWAIAAGVGFQFALDWQRHRGIPKPLAFAMPSLFLLFQAVGIVSYHPHQLSYYNQAVGGLAGAHALGLEADYWGESVRQPIFDNLAHSAKPGDRAILVPTLHDLHPAYLNQNPLLDRDILILPANEANLARAHWAIAFNRGGYIHDPVPLAALQGDVIHEIAQEGVWLARLIKLPARDGSSPSHPED